MSKKMTATEKWAKKQNDRIKAKAPAKRKGGPSPAPKPVKGVERGVCAFPVKPGKACNKESWSKRGRWCKAHQKVVRKAQLAFNNVTWRGYIKKGENEHYLWRGDRPTMAAFKSDKNLKLAKQHAKELHPKWDAKKIDSLIAKEKARLLEKGLRINPALSAGDLKALGSKKVTEKAKVSKPKVSKPKKEVKKQAAGEPKPGPYIDPPTSMKPKRARKAVGLTNYDPDPNNGAEAMDLGSDFGTGNE